MGNCVSFFKNLCCKCDWRYPVKTIRTCELTLGKKLCNYPFCININRMTISNPNEYCITYRNYVYCNKTCLARHKEMGYCHSNLEYTTAYADL